MCLAIFPLHLSTVLHLPRKSDAKLSQEINAHLPISLMSMSLVLRLPGDLHPSGSSSNVPWLPRVLKLLQNHHVLLTSCTVPCACNAKPHLIARNSPYINFPRLTFQMCFATTACIFSTSQLPNMLPCWCILYMFTSTCASCHNSVHFSTSQLPKVLQTWCALHMLTWKCASRHKGVTCFISHVAKWLGALCFRAYFSTHQNNKPLQKHTERRFFYLFLHLRFLFSEPFFPLIFFSSCFFDSSTLPTSAFYVCPYCWTFDFTGPHMIDIC